MRVTSVLCSSSAFLLLTLAGCGGSTTSPDATGGNGLGGGNRESGGATIGGTSGAISGTGGSSTGAGKGGVPGAGGTKAGTGGSSTLGGARAAGGSAGSKASGASGQAAGGGLGLGGRAESGGSGGSAGLPGSGCTPEPMTMTGELKGRYGTLKAMIGRQEYFLQVNEWNSTGTQRMGYGGDYYFKMLQQDGSASTSGGPTGFPSLFIGANANHSTAGSNLPKQVSALTTVPTTWNWKDNGTLADPTTHVYNVAYDVWFSTRAEGEPAATGPSGGYLMVWLHDPPSAQPIGRVVYPAVTIPGVSGTWDVWVGPNGTRPCISYVRTEPTLSMSYDLNLFIKDAVQNRPDTILNEWHLTNIFVGFEIWRGGVGLETTNFCAIVN